MPRALAHNDNGLQAAEIRFPRGGSFWGVQYHPEYSCAEVAAMARRYAEVLIRDGLVKDQAELDALVADLKAFDANPADARLAWRLRRGARRSRMPASSWPSSANWLERKVLG